MTVFCPNCGKPNTDTAAQCVGCGTELQAKAQQQQKFKGTMMMSGLGAPPPPGGSPAPGGPPAGAPPAGPPPGGPPAGGPPGGAFGQPPPGGGFGGTPPPGGGGAFGSPGAPPGGPPPGGGFGSPAPGGPPPGGGFGGAPPPGGEKQGMAFQKTMAMSSAEAFGPGGPGAALGGPPPGGGFGGGPGSSPGGGPPPGGGFGPPGGPPGGGFGAPPPSGPGGFGAPPPGGAPPAQAKKSNTLKYVGIGCGALLLLSCCIGGGFYGWVYYEAQNAIDETNDTIDEVVADATEASGGGGEATGGSVCDRAQRCCEAYVNEMNSMTPGMFSSATTCAGIAAARGTAFADTTCQSTIDGFRNGLTGAQRTVPADCQ